jgi:acyl-CoA thioesterase-1
VLVLALTSVIFIPLAEGATSRTQELVIILGDSLSAAYGLPEDAGWASLLQARLDENQYPLRIVNASITGETSSGGASRIDALLAQHRPRYVILELGGNDGLRGLSLVSMRQNLERVVQRSQTESAYVILLGMQIPPNYGRKYTTQFQEVYSQIAEQNDLAFVPFLLDGIAQDPQLMQADGIHPGAAAQEAMLDHVWSAFRPLIDKTQ